MSKFCWFFSGCWRCNANGRSRNALLFLHHKENLHESTNSIRVYFEIFLKCSCRLYAFATELYFLSSVLLNCRIKVVTIVNSTQMSLTWTSTINNYVCSSLICLCWLNKTHFWNVLSKLFSTLRLSEMLLLFINCLISLFESTFYKQVLNKNHQRSDQP